VLVIRIKIAVLDIVLRNISNVWTIQEIVAIIISQDIIVMANNVYKMWIVNLIIVEMVFVLKL
jgi:hypothetical protein